MKEVIVLAGADAQVTEIYIRLEQLEEGLGDAFYADFLRNCAQLSRFPELAPRFDARHRRLLLNNRRYGVFYTVAARRVVVSAVMDLRQDPERIHRYLDSL